MATPDDNSASTQSRSGIHLFLIIVAVIVLSITAFLVLRPNPSGTAPQNNTPAAPAH